MAEKEREIPRRGGVFVKGKLQRELKENLERFGVPDMLLLRVITSYFCYFATEICRLRRSLNILSVDTWREFAARISFTDLIVSVLAGVVIMSAISCFLPKKYKGLESVAAIGATIFFSCALLWRYNNVYLSVGVTVVALVVIGYALGKLGNERLSDKIDLSVCGIGVLIITVVSTVFIIVISIYKHRVFASTTHDFGLFVQMFHSLAEDLSAVTTLERDKLMSHFEVHASYIYYFLVPFFKLFPREETLLVAQAVLSMGGVIPLFLIAKRRGFKGASLVFICAMYAFCTGLIAPCFYDFHENAFLPTLLMWLLWTVECGKAVPFYILSVLVCIVKEDAPLYIICIGMYWFFEYKGNAGRFHGLISAGCAGVYMMLITSWLTKHGDGEMMTTSRFGHLLVGKDGGIVDVVINSLSNPGYLLSLLVQEDTLAFFVQMLLPLMFLPLFTKKVHRFLIIIPFVVTNLIIGVKYGYAANANFQYVFGTSVLLIFMTVINVSDFSDKMKKDLPILLGCAALIMSIGTTSNQVSRVANYNKDKAYYQSLEKTLDSLPDDAVIGGDPFLLPHIADKDNVYIFDFKDVNKEEKTINEPEKYDYIVLRNGAEMFEFAEPLLEEEGYIKLETDVAEKVTVFKNTNRD